MKKLDSTAIALNNIVKKPFRTAGLMLTAAVLTFVFLFGSVLSKSLSNGLINLKNRMGADLMAVPVGYDKDAEGILLKGEPSYFYFDKSTADKISSIEGVAQSSYQFYLTSLNQECCDVSVQFIGFNPDTDFSILPWISKVYSGKIEDGALVVGSDISLKDGNTLKFFDKQYTVAAQLDETGTGLDQAVYANMNTIKDLFESAKKKGIAFTRNINPDNSISTVLIKTAEGYTASQVKHNIRSSIDGIQVIETKNITRGISDNLKRFNFIINIFVILLFVMAFATLAIVFALSANERRREFALYRIFGAQKSFISSVIIKESIIISGAGGIIGMILSSVIVFPFSVAIEDALKLPYLIPDAGSIILIILQALAISLLIGPLSALRTVWKLYRSPAYTEVREGE